MGTYASRSTPTGGAATAVIARKLREKAKKIAAHLLGSQRVRPRMDRIQLQGQGHRPQAKTIQDIAFAAYTDFPEDVEAGLEGVHYYNPPRSPIPFGSYAVVVEVDAETGEWKPLAWSRWTTAAFASTP